MAKKLFDVFDKLKETPSPVLVVPKPKTIPVPRPKLDDETLPPPMKVPRRLGLRTKFSPKEESRPSKGKVPKKQASRNKTQVLKRAFPKAQSDTAPSTGRQPTGEMLDGDDGRSVTGRSVPKGTESPPKRGRGRPRKGESPRITLSPNEYAQTRKDQAQKARDASNSIQKENRSAIRDIAPLPYENIDWERRNACKNDLALFLKTYLARTFALDWSDDHRRCISKLEDININGGMFALAMPRGQGKTAMCRGATIWCTAYGHRKFPFLINSSGPKAVQTLDYIKVQWYGNRLLQQDFPEIGYPVLRVENRWHLARGQTYNGFPTFIEWGQDTVRYPGLILPKEIADAYLKHDPESLIYVKDFDAHIAQSACTLIRTAGIDGSIRGEADAHPILLTQPRPDLALLDDLQKDQKAESPASVDKLILLIDGAIQGLAGPGKRIAALFPCTVIREGDASDQYVNPKLKYQWRGERCRLVTSWPEGINDFQITLESKAGELWNKYADLRRESYLQHEDGRLSDAFLKKNFKEMHQGFEVSWNERYGNPEVDDNGKVTRSGTDLSPQHHAMNLRLDNPKTFASEFQNIGRSLVAGSITMISSEQLAEKVIQNLPRYTVPAGDNHLVAFIDVQHEMLYYSVLSCNPEFTGVFCDYGTYPQVDARYFHKHQTEGWGLLTRQFLSDYPNQVSKAFKDSHGRTRVPLEAKIYHALGLAVKYLLSLEFVPDNGSNIPRQIQKIGIDCRDGKTQDVIKRFCKEWGTRRYQQESVNRVPSGVPNEQFIPKSNLLIPCQGLYVPPTHKQFEEQTRHPGWIFENSISPQVREVKFIYKPDTSGQYLLQNDVSRWKTFLFQRLATPPGSPGCISLFDDDPQNHQMWCDQVCNSEYPEEVEARGLRKEMWQERDGRPDNEALDTAVGCLSLASLSGAFVRTEISQGKAAPTQARNARRFSKLWASKRRKA